MTDRDARYISRAITLAKKATGATSPNPLVGALVVKGSRVLAEGYHRKAGSAHAEALALKRAGKRARGSELFITLEPCTHHGRTPPCVDAIIEAGVRRVVIGARDPNPLVNGRGIKRLKRAGVEVTQGVLANECSSINEPYNKFITKGVPFVTLKLASTLDGKIATANGASKWITSETSRGLVHRMRSESDAVMVGVGTVLADDPELTARVARSSAKGLKNPTRVVVDSSLNTPTDARLFGRAKAPTGEEVVIVTTRDASKRRELALARCGASVVRVASVKDGVSLKAAMRALGKRGITSVLVEGGSGLGAGLLKAGLVDKLYYFISPKILGADALSSVGPLGVKSPRGAKRLKTISLKKSGEDILVEGRF